MIVDVMYPCPGADLLVSGLNRGDHFARHRVIPERDEYLIEQHIIEHVVTCAPQSFREARRILAGALDEIGQTVSSE